MRSCVKCYKDGIRCESRFMCGFCPDNPVLCVDPCIRNYHMELDFSEGYNEDKDYISEKDTTVDTSVYSVA